MIDTDTITFMITIFLCGIVLLSIVLSTAISSIKLLIVKIFTTLIECNMLCEKTRRERIDTLIKELNTAKTEIEKDEIRSKMRWYRSTYLQNRKKI